MKFKIFKAGLLASFSASSRLSCLALLNVTLRNSPTVTRVLIEQNSTSPCWLRRKTTLLAVGSRTISCFFNLLCNKDLFFVSLLFPFHSSKITI